MSPREGNMPGTNLQPLQGLASSTQPVSALASGIGKVSVPAPFSAGVEEPSKAEKVTSGIASSAGGIIGMLVDALMRTGGAVKAKKNADKLKGTPLPEFIPDSNWNVPFMGK